MMSEKWPRHSHNRATTWRGAVAVICMFAANATAPIHIAIAAEPATPRLWFANCAYEANRYFSCRIASPAVEEHIKSRPGVHPGVALTEFVRQHFEGSGCQYAVTAEAFRINGVFYSFDTQAFEKIACPGQSSKAKFSPDKAVALNLIEFWFDLPPELLAR